jgi:hypothetical protein
MGHKTTDQKVVVSLCVFVRTCRIVQEQGIHKTRLDYYYYLLLAALMILLLGAYW